MLLIHQAGSVKVGEVVRYTLEYTPSLDRILPSPSHLFVKIKNTSAIPLRAAWVHGPYQIHVATYPASFTPNQKFEESHHYGVPEFEPNLKPAAHWISKLKVPSDIRESGDKANVKHNLDGSPRSGKWVIEIASQVLFSNTASVHFELLVGRDERSLELGFAAVAGRGHGEPGQVSDFRARTTDFDSSRSTQQPKGVYSRAVNLLIEDTAALWNKPALPQVEPPPAASSGDDQEEDNQSESNQNQNPTIARQDAHKNKKKFHLVVLSHGLHGNVGADLLYLKESIDAAAKQAREDARKHRLSQTERKNKNQDGNEEGEADDHDEEVIVRGFMGNVVRTERGIKYLGKRLAKFVLTMTYPDQPFLPKSKSMARALSGGFRSSPSKSSLYGSAVHEGSSVEKHQASNLHLPYTFTSISFIGHSLGGLIQTYAVGYIQKHSPGFFDKIKPINFVALASPMLGLSNENPLYVKFALDFGLVGSTGRDLGLTWRPNVSRTVWSSFIPGFGDSAADGIKDADPRSKPLLQILPTGPAGRALSMFRNRTVYANVVNDGVVPLRTSCLLFLDWRGLDRVESARRENGLISTMAAFGWAELTGANSGSHAPLNATEMDRKDPLGDDNNVDYRQTNDQKDAVPDAHEGATRSENSEQTSELLSQQFLNVHRDLPASSGSDTSSHHRGSIPTIASNPLSEFINFFRPISPRRNSPRVSKKAMNSYKRGQITGPDPSNVEEGSDQQANKPRATRGDSLVGESDSGLPPTTSVLDAATDILNPPLPPVSWLIDPSSRDRTIFHDRIYHPEDIPAPSFKRPRLTRSQSSQESLHAQDRKDPTVDSTGMKVEEKIARAYHYDLSWRKVLVRLEPDAHNNMIVRRMFANAYGWDVVKHICDTHFAYTYAALTGDDDEPKQDRAKALDKPVTENAEEVQGQTDIEPPPETRHTDPELREARDSLADLSKTQSGAASMASTSSKKRLSREYSGEWSDSVFEGSDDESEAEDEPLNPYETFQKLFTNHGKPKRRPKPKLGRTDSRSRSQPAPESSRGAAKVASEIVQSPQALHGDADTMEPFFSAHNEQASLPREENQIFNSTTELGLQKPPEAHIAGSGAMSQGGSEDSARVAEQIARLSISAAKDDS